MHPLPTWPCRLYVRAASASKLGCRVRSSLHVRVDATGMCGGLTAASSTTSVPACGRCDLRASCSIDCRVEIFRSVRPGSRPPVARGRGCRHVATRHCVSAISVFLRFPRGERSGPRFSPRSPTRHTLSLSQKTAPWTEQDRRTLTADSDTTSTDWHARETDLRRQSESLQVQRAQNACVWPLSLLALPRRLSRQLSQSDTNCQGRTRGLG